MAIFNRSKWTLPLMVFTAFPKYWNFTFWYILGIFFIRFCYLYCIIQRKFFRHCDQQNVSWIIILLSKYYELRKSDETIIANIRKFIRGRDMYSIFATSYIEITLTLPRVALRFLSLVTLDFTYTVYWSIACEFIYCM
jgi:hypothetical protein